MAAVPDGPAPAGWRRWPVHRRSMPSRVQRLAAPGPMAACAGNLAQRPRSEQHAAQARPRPAPLYQSTGERRRARAPTRPGLKRSGGLAGARWGAGALGRAGQSPSLGHAYVLSRTRDPRLPLAPPPAAPMRQASSSGARGLSNADSGPGDRRNRFSTAELRLAKTVRPGYLVPGARHGTGVPTLDRRTLQGGTSHPATASGPCRPE